MRWDWVGSLYWIRMTSLTRLIYLFLTSLNESRISLYVGGICSNLPTSDTPSNTPPSLDPPTRLTIDPTNLGTNQPRY